MSDFLDRTHSLQQTFIVASVKDIVRTTYNNGINPVEGGLFAGLDIFPGFNIVGDQGIFTFEDFTVAGGPAIDVGVDLISTSTSRTSKGRKVINILPEGQGSFSINVDQTDPIFNPLIRIFERIRLQEGNIYRGRPIPIEIFFQDPVNDYEMFDMAADISNPGIRRQYTYESGPITVVFNLTAAVWTPTEAANFGVNAGTRALESAASQTETT